MKKLILSITIIFVVCSCEQKTNINSGLFLLFTNREVNKIMANYGDLYDYTGDKSNIKLSDLSLFVITFPIDYSQSFPVTPYVRQELFNLKANPDPVIESNIDHYFETQIKSKMSMMTKVSLLEIDYRTEPLKEFKIVSTVPVFGKNAGESLNEFFNIKTVGPKGIVISALNKNVIIEKSGVNIPKTIHELVAQNIMTPSLILIKYNAPNMLTNPVTTSFIIEMKVGDKTLSFQTSPTTLY